MENKNQNGFNDLASRIKSGFTFFYPAGGGDLKTTEEVFDYWKRTDYSYAISCRELPDFRGILLKDAYGAGYTLHMGMQNSNKGWYDIYFGKRLTPQKMQKIINRMVEFVGWNLK